MNVPVSLINLIESTNLKARFENLGLKIRIDWKFNSMKHYLINLLVFVNEMGNAYKWIKKKRITLMLSMIVWAWCLGAVGAMATNKLEYPLSAKNTLVLPVDWKMNVLTKIRYHNKRCILSSVTSVIISHLDGISNLCATYLITRL